MGNNYEIVKQIKKCCATLLPDLKINIRIFVFIFVAYLINSYVVNNKPEDYWDWEVFLDVVFGLTVSVFFSYLLEGVKSYQSDTLPAAILTGGLLTVLGMGMYGLLNNALELDLTTQRSEYERKGKDKYDVIVLNLGLKKPQYTRVKVLDVKINVLKQPLSNGTSTLNSQHIDLVQAGHLTAEIKSLTVELKNKDDHLIEDKHEGIFLVPGDQVSYSLPLYAKSNEVVRFDVNILCQQVILGYPIRWSRPQWSSSVVSVHEDSEDKHESNKAK